MTVTPAYGRDYKTAAAATADWEAGKDFIVNDITCPWDGKPCSVRDFKKTERIQLRYKKLTEVTIVHGAKDV